MKTLIEVVREVGFSMETSVSVRAAERFAELVRADEREKSLQLWLLLDDIDTADDIAKANNDLYRRLCQKIHVERWTVLNETEIDAALKARSNT